MVGALANPAPFQLRAGARWGSAWLPLLLAAAVCLTVMAAQRGFDLRLQDEGFLWYGAQRVLQGELPIRDFQAYDPGRYFWSAGWMALLGSNGILALRWGNAALGALTVALATWVVRSGAPSAGLGLLLPTALIFTLWMVPDYKVSDSFAAVLLLFGLTRLFQSPSLPRCLQFGVCLGVASTIGINHALYGCIAGFLAFLALRGAPALGRAILWGSAGAILGYSPVLALHLIAPGYTAAFIDSIRQIMEAGTTNLTLPWPDPLAVFRPGTDSLLRSATITLMAVLFAVVPLLWAWAAWTFRSQRQQAKLAPAVVAGLILSLPYAHYVVSRADDVHLAVSILPLLTALLAWSATFGNRRRLLIAGGSLAASVVMTASLQPAFYVARTASVAVEVDGARLVLTGYNAAEVRAAQAVAAAAGSGNFFAGPYIPGAYALARQRSPTWEIYLLFPASLARQRAELERLEATNVRYALISGTRIDGRQDLGLDRTHPLLFDYLRRCVGAPVNFPVPPQFTVGMAAKSACHARRNGHAQSSSRSTHTVGHGR